MIVEPNINVLPDGFIDDKTQLVGLVDALNGCDVVVLLVDHSSFRDIDPNLLSKKQIIDTRGIWAKLL
jgi:UDP-N-acetyl-D-mannosaminuronic acid dehydrogenase